MADAVELSAHDLRHLMTEAAFVQPIVEMLHLPPIHGLGSLGLPRRIDARYRFGHIGLQVLDNGTKPLFEIHGLARHARPGMPGSAIGKMGSKLQCCVLAPEEAAERLNKNSHRRKNPSPSQRFAITPEDRQRIGQRLACYVEASAAQPARYTIPVTAIKYILRSVRREFLDGKMRQKPAAGDRVKSAMVLALPNPILALAIRQLQHKPVYVYGPNSNVVASDIARLFGFNLAHYFPADIMPGMGKTVSHWFRATRDSIIMPQRRLLVPHAAAPASAPQELVLA